MNQQGDEFNRYLPDEGLDKDKLSIEVPAEQRPVQYDRIPSGFEPMGEIQLRGRVFRGLASGQTPWWILITGWAVFGGLVGVLLHTLWVSSALWLLLPLAIAVIPLFILWKGTTAKISDRRRRGR